MRPQARCTPCLGGPSATAHSPAGSRQRAWAAAILPGLLRRFPCCSTAARATKGHDGRHATGESANRSGSDGRRDGGGDSRWSPVWQTGRLLPSLLSPRPLSCSSSFPPFPSPHQTHRPLPRDPPPERRSRPGGVRARVGQDPSTTACRTPGFIGEPCAACSP